MLSEPPRSPYDWEFRIFGFYTRVAWTFWMMSAVIGYQWAHSIDQAYYEFEKPTPGMLGLLAIWIAISFVFTLLHELGHAVALRSFGLDSYMVLYHFGGLAVPTFAQASRRKQLSHFEEIVVAAAGPAIQLVVGIAAVAFSVSIGHGLGSARGLGQLVGISIPAEAMFDNAAWTALLDSLIFVNIYWPLLNLIPTLPLDGGRILQHTIGWIRRTSGFFEASIVGFLVCIAAAFYSYQNGMMLTAIMFAVFGMTNYQNQSTRP